MPEIPTPSGVRVYLALPLQDHAVVASVGRISRLLPAPVTQDMPQRQLGPLILDANRQRLFAGERDVGLTKSEFSLFCLLAEQPGRAYMRGEHLGSLGYAGVEKAEGRTLDSHVWQLRKKLREASWMVETIRGVGFRLHTDRGDVGDRNGSPGFSAGSFPHHGAQEIDDHEA